MRSLDERIAEIKRRSEKILKVRQKRRKGLLLGGVPLILCLSVITALFFQWRAPANQGQTVPVGGDHFSYFSQVESESHGTVTVFGPGMIRIHLDRYTVTRASYLLTEYHPPASEGIVDRNEGSAITYKIILKQYGVKTTFRLSGNTLEVMTDGRSYSLTDDQVSLLKEILYINDISTRMQICIIALTVILLLVVLLIPIHSVPKDPTYRNCRQYTALAYKVVCWNIPTDSGTYQKIAWYGFPNNFKSLDRLCPKDTSGKEFIVRKRKRIIVLVCMMLLAVLFVPIPNPKGDPYNMQYMALTYKIVCWGSSGRTAYQKTACYGFPDNFKSLHELWVKYIEPTVRTVTATVLEINEDTVVVQPIKSEEELHGTDRISFSKEHMANIDPAVGSDVDIDYIGDIVETYPVQIQALRWRMATDLRHREYTEQWLSPETAKQYFEHHGPAFTDITITEIYSDCFIARPCDKPYTVKLNGQLSDEWNVGDLVICTYEKLYFDETNRRMEADMLTIEASDVPIEYTPFTD